MNEGILSQSRLARVRPSATKAMTALARSLSEQGRSIITLSQGEPDFDTPDIVCEAGIEAIRTGKTRYTAVAGISSLREAVAAEVEARTGVRYDIDCITVGCGAKQVIFNALLATLDQGDEVVIPAPCWVSYPDMVHLAGGNARVVLTLESNGFKLGASELLANVTPRTKWVMLNSPSNPTGAVYTRAELEGLAEVLRQQPGVHVLSDDVYADIFFEESPPSLLAVAPDLVDRILIVGGTSKSSAMTGWRIGYGAGAKNLIGAMNTIQGQTSSHTSSISQHAAIAAIANKSDFISRFVDEYKLRRDILVDRINDIDGLKVTRPDGAFYAFVNCEGLIGKAAPNGKKLTCDDDVAMYLLDSAGVAVVAGSGFLMSPYIRLSFALDSRELETALDRIEESCLALS